MKVQISRYFKVFQYNYTEVESLMSAATSRRGSQVSDSLHLEQEEGEARLRAVSLSDGVIGRTLMIDNPRIR